MRDDGQSIEIDRALSRLREPGDDVEERRLARAVGADQADDAPLGMSKSTERTATRPPKRLVILARARA